MKRKLMEIFGVEKPVIGMLHLDYLEGENFKGTEQVIGKAKRDLLMMQEGGIDGVMIENWNELSIGEFVNEEVKSRLFEVSRKLMSVIKVPFGFNILNNDYKVAFELSQTFGASFIELDTFVDDVESDFSTNLDAMKRPFRIYPDPVKIVNYAKGIGLIDFPILSFVQPKHYIMLDKQKKIEESVQQAVDNFAAGILITKETGFAPTKELIVRAKNAAGNTPVGIGSGFSVENAYDFLPIVDFVVVGSALKKDGSIDKEVDKRRVVELMNIVINYRENGQKRI